MSRNLKVLGLALVAVLALGAMAASAASAHTFKSEKEQTVITSDNDVQHRFAYGSGTVVCSTSEFKATQVGAAAASLTVFPTYTGCEFLEAKAEVHMTHCDYLFTANTVKNAAGEEHAPVHIQCPAGKQIDVIVPELANCTLTIGSQTSTAGVRYTNTGAGKTRDVTVAVTAKVNATRHNPGGNFLCGLLPAAGVGTYTGSSVVTGFEDKGGPTVVEDATTTETTRTYPQGERVGIEVS